MPESNGAARRADVGDSPNGRSPLLHIDDLTVGFVEKGRSEPVRIVRNVDLTVGRHEVVGLVGESGSGKTQTARAVLKINTRPLQPLSGHIYLDGVDQEVRVRVAEALLGLVREHPRDSVGLVVDYSGRTVDFDWRSHLLGGGPAPAVPPDVLVRPSADPGSQ